VMPNTLLLALLLLWGSFSIAIHIPEGAIMEWRPFTRASLLLALISDSRTVHLFPMLTSASIELGKEQHSTFLIMVFSSWVCWL
jgi:hypothetical protein